MTSASRHHRRRRRAGSAPAGRMQAAGTREYQPGRHQVQVEAHREPKSSSGSRRPPALSAVRHEAREKASGHPRGAVRGHPRSRGPWVGRPGSARPGRSQRASWERGRAAGVHPELPGPVRLRRRVDPPGNAASRVQRPAGDALQRAPPHLCATYDMVARPGAGRGATSDTFRARCLGQFRF
jgi:hypothetical protein